MGSLFKPKEAVPPPPAPPATLQDQVNGVEQVPVTNADGSVTYVTRALPLTAAQQAQRDELNKIMQESLAQIKQLSAADYAPDESTTKVLDQWEKTQQTLLRDSFEQRSNAEEQQLAQRGLADSTAAQAQRRQRDLDLQRARENVSNNRLDLVNQIRSERLGLQQNLFNLAQNQVDLSTARTAQAAVRGQSELAALNAQRQASILDYYNARNNTVSDTFGRALGTGLGGTLGKAAGGAVGGPIGAVAGGWLGSLFARR